MLSFKEWLWGESWVCGNQEYVETFLKFEYINSCNKKKDGFEQDWKRIFIENHFNLRSHSSFWKIYASSTWLLSNWNTRNGRKTLPSKTNYGNQENVDSQNEEFPFKYIYHIGSSCYNINQIWIFDS